MVFATWSFDASFSFNYVLSPYFQPMLDVIGSIGARYKAPSYNDMKINLLYNYNKECQLLIDRYRSQFTNYGNTNRRNGQGSQHQRILINFLMHCLAGSSFVESDDASYILKILLICIICLQRLLIGFGLANVMHLVTDNARNYVGTSGLIHEKCDHIYQPSYATQ